ncbi:PREDICTED: receptor-like cytosolic serine/threonine-protein kinase RBK1 [Nicotiana attenuata]|uniref:non-specific serine/threonine protein kinase n=1 Tax=Nicotiana attenuata TaxID=49451 RepID=A0A314L847_NICAT|nr:PREDICTED: receptor-like cytosolic serine/threonine-protein kinase RBK1 [Nicotiana attenuata]OIT37715.1 receptor-like cytosolic serinethreonine-protein kinase rbk1 [Nicotiana attenuata]
MEGRRVAACDQENGEKEGNKKDEKRAEDNNNNNNSEDNQYSSSLSPRGVLEIPTLNSSDSDNSSISSSDDRSSSFASSSSGELIQGVYWKNLFDNIKRRSMRRLSSIPLLGGYETILPKNIRRILSKNKSAEEESSDCDDDSVIPKPSWRNFSYRDLAEATDNFNQDNLIGQGGHAEVYKGCLPDGQIVAVKKITKQEKNDEDKVDDFLSELGIIAHINHPNAAKLIGYSADGGLYLVLQFLPHGSISTLLHGSEERLEWEIRYKVAVGVAEGLHYLHCDCQKRIIHRDITASNILLTEDYEPQISDFGLAKWLPEKWVHHVVSPIEGTFGYMAPEYFMHGIVNEKTDVFAFGVLLLELITGRRAVDSYRKSLVMWAKPLLENNSIKEIADPRLGDAYDVVEMKRAMFTALTCLHNLPDMRPYMKKVVQLLKGENAPVEMKQKSMGGRALMFSEDYTSTNYLQDLNRHMELVME